MLGRALLHYRALKKIRRSQLPDNARGPYQL